MGHDQGDDSACARACCLSLESKGFLSAYWVGITSVEDEKDRIIGLYECQSGATHIAANKRLNGDFRGRNMLKPANFAEAYAVYPGTAQGAKCIF